MTQLELFDLSEAGRNKERQKESRVDKFTDYEAFVSKFRDKPKTTDDCYTPPDVYEAVLGYVNRIYPLEAKGILRPFYPGGDYQNCFYPDNDVVIDNPPFSIMSQIVKFYMRRKVPFFLFAPGMTVFDYIDKGASVVIVSPSIKFNNGAVVKCNFVTNLLGDIAVLSSPLLSRDIAACQSQKSSKRKALYKYPENVISVSDMQTIAKGYEEYAIRRNHLQVTKSLDNHRALFGAHLLVPTSIAMEVAAMEVAAREAAVIELSEREKRIIKELDKETNKKLIRKR